MSKVDSNISNINTYKIDRLKTESEYKQEIADQNKTGVLGLFANNIIIKRVFICIFSVVAVLGSMAACSIPGLPFGNNAPAPILGVLKRDPKVLSSGFGQIRDISGVDCKNNPCLGNQSGLKLEMYDSNTLFFLTKSKGLFRTTNGGRNWERLYTFPIQVNTKKTITEKGQTKEVDKTKDEISNETNGLIAKNDSFQILDFALDKTNPNKIFVAGKYDSAGKIYLSEDAGKTFKEIYTEVNQNSVTKILLDQQNTNVVYAALDKGALIKSVDGGVSWQKIKAFSEVIAQLGFIEQPGNPKVVYALLPNRGLYVSQDMGFSWYNLEFRKIPSRIGELQKSALNIFSDGEKFSGFEKVIPIYTQLSSLNATPLPVDKSKDTDETGLTRDISETNKNSTQSTNNALQIPGFGQGGESNNQAPKAPTFLKNQAFIVVADNQVWLSTQSPQLMQKMVLPLQSEQYNILDVELDPQKGIDKILVSVDNKLFETTNRGQSWNTKDKIELSGKVGMIGQIVIDPSDTEVIYLMLMEGSRNLFGN